MTSNEQEERRINVSSGLLLATATLIALFLANSPLSLFYLRFLETPVTVAISDFIIAKPLLLWINDGLMALFFLMVGLELKREILVGKLSSIQHIVLPCIAAIAGILLPAATYTLFNLNDDIAINGWAIPSATDIAFALGIFCIFGSSLPSTLKLFLLSVAIFDDIGAIIIIAAFYSQDLSTHSLVFACIGLMVLFGLNKAKVNSLPPYVIVGIAIWCAVLKSGVHATLAGFVIAFFIPLHLKNKHQEAMLPALEAALRPWVGYLILPVFAFANAGVSIIHASAAELFNSVTLGIALGLFIGKQIGIFGACWLAIHLKLASLPKGASWLQLYGVSLLCGVGFTMSLFIGTLAFEPQGLAYQSSVKIGVLLGSLMSALAGAIVLIISKPNRTYLQGSQQGRVVIARRVSLPEYANKVY